MEKYYKNYQTKVSTKEEYIERAINIAKRINIFNLNEEDEKEMEHLIEKKIVIEDDLEYLNDEWNNKLMNLELDILDNEEMVNRMSPFKNNAIDCYFSEKSPLGILEIYKANKIDDERISFTLPCKEDFEDEKKLYIENDKYLKGYIKVYKLNFESVGFGMSYGTVPMFGEFTWELENKEQMFNDVYNLIYYYLSNYEQQKIFDLFPNLKFKTVGDDE